MSTRCLIGIKENDKVRYIYCHNDGYIHGGVGETLAMHYKTVEAVNELMKLGDLSKLGSIPKSTSAAWNRSAILDQEALSFCVAYRDRGETGVEVKTVEASEYDFRLQDDASYIYLFDVDTNSWTYLRSGTAEFKPVKLDS